MYRLEVIAKFGKMGVPHTGYIFYVPYESWEEYRQLIFDNINRSYVDPIFGSIVFEHAVLKEEAQKHRIYTKEEVLETLKTPPIRFHSVRGGEPRILPDLI